MLHKKIGKYMIPMALGALFTTGAYTFTVYADEVDSVSVETEVSEYHSESDATEAVNMNTTLDNTSNMVVSETNQSLTGWQQNKYLINGEPVTGFRSIDGSNYFFDADGNRMSGIIDGKYFGEDGKQQYGFVHLTNQDGTIQTYFYDVSGNKQTGWQTIDQNTYYFDPSTGASYTGLHQIGNDNYYFESNGTLLKNASGKIVNNLRFNTNNNGRITFTELVNRPTYYNQADRRWAFNYVAGVPFWQIGCVPSVATSVITYLEGNVVQSPYQVGQQFVNWGTMGYFGSTEMSWFKLAEKYHWNIENHLNLNQIKNALLQGQLVTTAVRYDGRYCQVPGGTHQLLLMGYDEATGKTYVYDPYHGSGSFTGEGGNLCGWYSLQHIWNYQSSIAIDTYGGGPFYAISKNKNIFLLNDIKDISQGEIHIGDQIYTGQTIAPVHGVVLGNTQLTEGIDYVISYQNNKTIGNALAMVTGIGKYAGVLHGNFHILNEKDTFGSNYKNGNYTIQVSADESKVVDIASGSTQEGSKVQIYSSNGTEAQGFYIEKQANGYYTIKNVKSGRYLTAPTGYTTVRNGTQVYQRLNCSELAKLWMIRKTNGSYILSSAYDGNYVLDITSAKIADGTVLQLYKGNGTVAQQWQFVPYVTIQEKTEQLLANSKTNIENKLIQSGKAYNIVGYGHTNYGIETAGGSYVNAANVQLYDLNGTEAQGWYVTFDEDGYVTFINVKSGKALDVNAARSENCTNIQQYTSNQTKAQKWIITGDAEHGYVLLSALDINKALDLNAAKYTDCSNIQLYQTNGTSAQQWQFVPYVTIQEKTEQLLANSKTNIENKLIQSGKAYNIVGYGHTNYGIETAGGSYANAANAQLYHLNGTEAQGWYVTFDKDGYATFSNVKSGKVLDVNAARSENCTNIQQYTSNQTKAQKWIITGDAEHGYVLLSALDINKALDLNAAKYTDCSNIQLYQTNGTSAQQWQFVPYVTIQEKTEQLLANSKTNIENKLIQSGKAYNIVGYDHADYGVEVAYGSLDNGGNVQLYHLNGTEAQAWYVTFDEDGYVTFINVKSGKALDVNAARSENCTNIQQYTSNQTKAQKWIITGDAEHGYVLLSALDINKALDLNAAKYTDCSNIQLYQTNGTSAQTWFFVECAPHKSTVKLPASDVKHWGVDISQFNGSDFDVTPYDFVLIRSNYGTTTDPLLETYVNACIQAGIPYGFYCYSYALSVDDAHTEAAYTLTLANQYKPTLGIWYDMEDADNYKTNRGVWTKDATLSFCQTFCKDVKSMGWYTGIYSSSWFIQNWYNTGLEDYDKWVAQWDANDGQCHSDTHTLGSIHQYTSVDDKYPNGLDKNAMYVDFDYYTLV